MFMSGIDETIAYLVEKFKIKGKLTDKEKFSFFFHLKDELIRVSEMERSGQASLVSQMPRNEKTKSRSNHHPAGKHSPKLWSWIYWRKEDPEKAQRIKKMPYD